MNIQDYCIYKYGTHHMYNNQASYSPNTFLGKKVGQHLWFLIENSRLPLYGRRLLFNAMSAAKAISWWTTLWTEKCKQSTMSIEWHMEGQAPPSAAFYLPWLGIHFSLGEERTFSSQWSTWHLKPWPSASQAP